MVQFCKLDCTHVLYFSHDTSSLYGLLYHTWKVNKKWVLLGGVDLTAAALSLGVEAVRSTVPFCRSADRTLFQARHGDTLANEADTPRLAALLSIQMRLQPLLLPI